jgi:hypothetical protein
MTTGLRRNAATGVAVWYLLSLANHFSPGSVLVCAYLTSRPVSVVRVSSRSQTHIPLRMVAGIDRNKAAPKKAEESIAAKALKWAGKKIMSDISQATNNLKMNKPSKKRGDVVSAELEILQQLTKELEMLGVVDEELNNQVFELEQRTQEMKTHIPRPPVSNEKEILNQLTKELELLGAVDDGVSEEGQSLQQLTQEYEENQHLDLSIAPEWLADGINDDFNMAPLQHLADLEDSVMVKELQGQVQGATANLRKARETILALQTIERDLFFTVKVLQDASSKSEALYKAEIDKLNKGKELLQDAVTQQQTVLETLNRKVAEQQTAHQKTQILLSTSQAQVKALQQIQDGRAQEGQANTTLMNMLRGENAQLKSQLEALKKQMSEDKAAAWAASVAAPAVPTVPQFALADTNKDKDVQEELHQTRQALQSAESKLETMASLVQLNTLDGLVGLAAKDEVVGAVSDVLSSWQEQKTAILDAGSGTSGDGRSELEAFAKQQENTSSERKKARLMALQKIIDRKPSMEEGDEGPVSAFQATLQGLENKQKELFEDMHTVEAESVVPVEEKHGIANWADTLSASKIPVVESKQTNGQKEPPSDQKDAFSTLDAVSKVPGLESRQHDDKQQKQQTFQTAAIPELPLLEVTQRNRRQQEQQTGQKAVNIGAAAGTAPPEAGPTAPQFELMQPQIEVPKEKLWTEDGRFIHSSFTCDSCFRKPIVGTRYHATNLKDHDICEPCFRKYGGKKLRFIAIESE